MQSLYCKELWHNVLSSQQPRKLPWIYWVMRRRASNSPTGWNLPASALPVRAWCCVGDCGIIILMLPWKHFWYVKKWNVCKYFFAFTVYIHREHFNLNVMQWAVSKTLEIASGSGMCYHPIGNINLKWHIPRALYFNGLSLHAFSLYSLRFYFM